MPVAKEEGTNMRLTGKAVRALSNQMMISLSETDRGEPCGEILHRYLQRPVPYHSLAELIFRLDGIARLLQISNGNTEFRSLQGKSETGGQALPEEYYRRNSFSGQSDGGFAQTLQRKGSRDIVCVELIGRQHMSLQGRIRSRRTGGEIYFRSALELMYLLSEHWLSRKEKLVPPGNVQYKTIQVNKE